MPVLIENIYIFNHFLNVHTFVNSNSFSKTIGTLRWGINLIHQCIMDELIQMKIDHLNFNYLGKNISLFENSYTSFLDISCFKSFILSSSLANNNFQSRPSDLSINPTWYPVKLSLHLNAYLMIHNFSHSPNSVSV